MELPSIFQEPFEEYRKQAKEHVSSHQLDDFRKCPALFFKKRAGLIPDTERPAFSLGRAAHTLILEGRTVFEQRYAIGGPVNPKTGQPFGAATKAFAEWAEKQGKPVLSTEQVALVTNLYHSVRAHSEAQKLLSDGVAEGVVRTEYGGLPCQIRMDWFNPFAGIVDLKTCDDLTWFEADAKRFGYLYQLAFYRAVLRTQWLKANYTSIVERFEAAGGIPVHLIAVEKKEPFRCGVWTLAPHTLLYAERENEAALDRLKRCIALEFFPTGYEERRVFDGL